MQTVLLPTHATILCVQAQRNVPCIWAKVSPRNEKVKRKFWIFGTGHPISKEEQDLHYVGTFQLDDGEFIGHLFTDEKE